VDRSDPESRVKKQVIKTRYSPDCFNLFIRSVFIRSFFYISEHYQETLLTSSSYFDQVLSRVITKLPLNFIKVFGNGNLGSVKCILSDIVIESICYKLNLCVRVVTHFFFKGDLFVRSMSRIFISITFIYS
jgi:hypothetical protein